MSGQVEHRVIAPPRRWPKLPTAFLPGFGEPELFVDLEALAARLAVLAGGQPISFTCGRAAYPGFDDFPSLTAHAGADYVATVFVPGVTAATAREALSLALGQPAHDEAA